jgi:hypothetical protein
VGELGWSPLEIPIPQTSGVARALKLEVTSGELRNRWTLVALPRESEPPASVARLEGLPYTEEELASQFEERSYSSGWGLPCRTWSPRRQDPARLLPRLATVAAGRVAPESARAIVTHRLTPELRDHMQRGGRCLLLAGPQAGGIGSKWINGWGLMPLIVEREDAAWPVRPDESDAVLAMLLHDLTAWTTRAVPVNELDLADHIDPIIRCVWTHDSGLPKPMDMAFSARVGEGMLVVSTLDHTGVAGRWMLQRLLRWAAEAKLGPAERELDIARFLLG